MVAITGDQDRLALPTARDRDASAEGIITARHGMAQGDGGGNQGGPSMSRQEDQDHAEGVGYKLMQAVITQTRLLIYPTSKDHTCCYCDD